MTPTDRPRTLPPKTASSAHVAVVMAPTGLHDVDGHRFRSHRRVAEQLAEVLGLPFEGLHDPARDAGRACYVVPDDTLVGTSAACRLGIRGAADLFGGVVPWPFVATKCISHPLPRTGAVSPAGWDEALGRRLEGCVLPGYTAFDVDDALQAVQRLARRYGAVRLKRPSGTGGCGQTVHGDAETASAELRSMATAEFREEGLVIEAELAEAVTWSVGIVEVGGLQAAYYGTQCTTEDNGGARVYGGSSLHVVRGGFDALLDVDMTEPARAAVRQAQVFHAAAFAAFPALCASRSNYDVMQGSERDGTPRTGVLEQSWRIGGASGAEAAALLAFVRDPACRRVRASTHEVYGAGAVPPPGATLLYRGDDRRVGPILKYVEVENDGDS